MQHINPEGDIAEQSNPAGANICFASENLDEINGLEGLRLIKSDPRFKALAERARKLVPAE